MTKQIRITQAEYELMNIIWDHAPIAASDLSEHLPVENHWSTTTIKTMLSRLVEKGALATKQDGRRFLYSAVFTRDDYRQHAAGSFVDRLFGGKAAPLVAHLAEDRGLTDDDISELEDLLTELKREQS